MYRTKTYLQQLLIILFAVLLTSCNPSTPTPSATPSPSPQPSATIVPTPVPTDALFPQMSQPVEAQMQALFIGRLILVDGCPRGEGSGGGSSLLVWPYNYTINRNTTPEEIRDSTGQVVAHIGDYITMGGGELPGYTEEMLPKGCAGPIWIVGEGPKVLDAYFPIQAGAGGFSSMTDVLEGTLVVVNGCLRVQTDDSKRFLLTWPGMQYQWDKDESYIFSPYQKTRIQVGGKIRVKGGEAPFLQSPPGDITKPMVAHPLPKECAEGPYWNVVHVEK